MPTNESEYEKIFTELIKKQMLLLGPEITLAKVKSVPGIIVEANGEVTSIQGDPQALLQSLINQFVELSGMIVKKTMESILTSYPNIVGLSSFAKASEGQGSAFVQPEVQNPVPPHVQVATPPTQAPVEPAVSPITMPTVESVQANPAPAPARQANMPGIAGGPLQPPVQMPPVEPTPPPPSTPPILEVAPSFAPPSQNATEGQSKATEGQAPQTQQPIQSAQEIKEASTASVEQPSQVHPASTRDESTQVGPTSVHDDLSEEEVEKLNKMIAEMNQMQPGSGEEASSKQ